MSGFASALPRPGHGSSTLDTKVFLEVPGYIRLSAFTKTAGNALNLELSKSIVGM